jgi:hypothetical protein
VTKKRLSKANGSRSRKVRNRKAVARQANLKSANWYENAARSIGISASHDGSLREN